MKNVIQFKKGFINLPLTSKGDEKTYLASMSLAGELMQFGYILKPETISNLSLSALEEIQKLHLELINFLKEATGSTRNYVPFWKGFPEEVMEKSEAELWLHQIAHYLSEGSYEPDEFTKARPSAFENPKYTTISWGTEEDYQRIFTDLVSINQSLTQDDLEIVKYFVSSGSKLMFPESIPFKENLCTLAGMGLDVPVKTTTDVLRIAVHMSGGDISLPPLPPKKLKKNRWSSELHDNPARELAKFKKFKRSERKMILHLLEKTNCDVREMVLKEGRWTRLGEILHPGEYKNLYPRAFKAFDALRNEKIKSWYGEVEAAFKTSFEAGVKKLAERPGELMRRMDWLLRTASDPTPVLNTFEEAGAKSSNKVLYETYGHFSNREKLVKGRSVMIKGARSRTALPDLPPLPEKVVQRVKLSVIDVLREKFSSMEKLGKVWIDEELKKLPLPTNMRSMSSMLRPTVRGQRVPIGNQDTKVIRAYVHWFDRRGTLDIDLTATFLGIEKVALVGWNGEHNSTLGCYSGDVRHRQGACAEYIDINVKEALKEGYKYVVIDARNYNGGSLAEIPECVFGYMERKHPRANQIFVPSTLANSVRLQSESSTTLVAAIDLENMEYIFLDIDQEGIPVASANLDAIMEALKPYTEAPEFSVYDLLKIHAESRGSLVGDREDAEVIFEKEKFMESYVEIAKWMGV